MKKNTFFTLAAVCMAVAANATILRVSNVEGSSAPYSDLQAAVDAANAGDTIMVDGSNTAYDKTTIDKRLVLIGPGFWVNENGLVDEAAPAAKALFLIKRAAAGTVIEGFSTTGSGGIQIQINADNCVIRRCYINGSTDYGIRFGRDNYNDDYLVSGAVIHQNFFNNSMLQGSTTEALSPSNIQITNNIFIDKNAHFEIEYFKSCYIAYNTMVGYVNYETQGNGHFRYVNSSTIEHNIVRDQSVVYGGWGSDDNEWSNNYIASSLLDVDGEEVHKTFKTDKDIRNAELALTDGKNYGAFAGDSPYVLSGIPAAPVIQDLVMPTTVEKGKKMNVTIKVGIQK